MKQMLRRGLVLDLSVAFGTPARRPHDIFHHPLRPLPMAAKYSEGTVNNELTDLLQVWAQPAGTYGGTVRSEQSRAPARSTLGRFSDYLQELARMGRKLVLLTRDQRLPRPINASPRHVLRQARGPEGGGARTSMSSKHTRLGAEEPRLIAR